jgi:6-phosphogluconolactonase (cycloisomerase 2 family)
VANNLTGTVNGFSVDAGQSAPASASVSIHVMSPTAMSGTPNGNLLFVATASGSILAYTIGSGGALQPANDGNPVASVPNATSMSMDRSGKLLFVASTSAPQLQVFQINPSNSNGNGYLVRTAQGMLPLDNGQPMQVFTTPDNRYVFVALGTGGLDVFALNASTGSLENLSNVAPLHSGTSKDTAIVSDNTSRYLYVAESGAGIRALTIGADGTLQGISGSPFASHTTAPSSLFVDPTNQMLYAAYTDAKVIAGYSIGSDGNLTSVSKTPFSTVRSPTALSLDASGKYLLAVGSSGVPSLKMFGFDSTASGDVAWAAQ